MGQIKSSDVADATKMNRDGDSSHTSAGDHMPGIKSEPSAGVGDSLNLSNISQPFMSSKRRRVSTGSWTKFSSVQGLSAFSTPSMSCSAPSGAGDTTGQISKLPSSSTAQPPTLINPNGHFFDQSNTPPQASTTGQSSVKPPSLGATQADLEKLKSEAAKLREEEARNAIPGVDMQIFYDHYDNMDHFIEELFHYHDAAEKAIPATTIANLPKYKKAKQNLNVRIWNMVNHVAELTDEASTMAYIIEIAERFKFPSYEKVMAIVDPIDDSSDEMDEGEH